MQLTPEVAKLLYRLAEICDRETFGKVSEVVLEEMGLRPTEDAGGFFTEEEAHGLRGHMDRAAPTKQYEKILVSMEYIEDHLTRKNKVPIDHKVIEECFKACNLESGDLYKALRDIESKYAYITRDPQRGFYSLNGAGRKRVQEMFDPDEQ